MKFINNLLGIFNKKPTGSSKTTVPDYKYKSSNNFLDLAINAFKQKSYPQALELAEKALEIYPDNVGAWQLKGEILVKQGNKEEAYRWFKKVIDISPEFQTKSWLGISKLLLENKKYETAREIAHYGLLVFDSPLYQNTKSLKDIMELEPGEEANDDIDKDVKQELLKVYEEASKKSTN